MNTRTVISLFLCTGGLATGALARGAVPFSDYDRDGSGTVSREEFLAARGAGAPAFETLDADRDGQLARSELDTGPGRRVAQRPNGRDTARGERGRADANLPTFADHDLNGDGAVTALEFEEAHRRRAEERTRQERPGRNGPDTPAFSAVDANGDGAITSEEFAAFRELPRQSRPVR